MTVRFMCLFGALACIYLCGCDTHPKDGSSKQIIPNESNQIEASNVTAAESATPSNQPPDNKTNTPPSAPPASTTSPPPANGPHWICDKPIHDFGEVWAGELMRHTFTFRNVGNQPLKILEARPRCSCSVAENYTRQAPPGGSGSIPFRLNTVHKSGSLDEYLTIKTNDPRQSNLTIRMQGYVKTVCELEVIADASVEAKNASPVDLQLLKKRRGDFGKIKKNDRLHRVIRMINTSGSPLTLQMLKIRPENAPFEIHFQVIQPDDVFELTIDGKPPFREGRSSASASFVTNIPDKQVYTVPIYAYVPPRIEMIPQKIVADETSWKIKRRTIKIINNGTTPFSIESVAVSDPHYKLTRMPSGLNNPHYDEIEVILPPGDYRPPPYGEVVRITTTDAEKPIIDLYVLPHLRRQPTPRPSDKPLKFFPGKGQTG